MGGGRVQKNSKMRSYGALSCMKGVVKKERTDEAWNNGLSDHNE